MEALDIKGIGTLFSFYGNEEVLTTLFFYSISSKIDW